MTLSPAFLDELRARTLLSSVIAPSVKLVKAGREYKACCPFHNEKTPSFTINDEKHFYHCFGCGAHGDAIRFLTDARGLPFMDAVKELAGKAGMDVPAPDPRSRERAERSAGLVDVTTAAQAFFVAQLASAEGAAARDYCNNRGIDEAAIRRFGIGFAPDDRGRLKRALDRFDEEALVDSGMLIRSDRGDTYDRFRGRLMIPIRDARGRVIAFGGRILGPGEPKYLNSPDTPLFDKGRTLYNLDLAAPASRSANRLIVVEGYMDVIGLDRAGIAEAVAPNGTALTEAQMERLWRLDPAPILCFDGDSAGQKAAIRAATRALPLLGPERTLRFADLPPGKDPDDLVNAAAAAAGGDQAARQRAGRAAIEALLADPVPLDEKLWRHELAMAPLTTPEARAGLRQRLIDHSNAIPDPSLRQLYRDAWMDRFRDTVSPRRSQAAGPRPFRPGKPFDRHRDRRFAYRATDAERFLQSTTTVSGTRTLGTDGIDMSTACALLVGFALFPAALPHHADQLAALPLTDPSLSRLRDALVDAAFLGRPLDRDTLVTILHGGGAAADLDGARRAATMAFSFTRAGTDPELAVRDLGVALDVLAADGEIGIALAAATERLSRGEEDAFEEQRRLLFAREEIKERLASLVGSD